MAAIIQRQKETEKDKIYTMEKVRSQKEQTSTEAMKMDQSLVPAAQFNSQC